MKEPDSDDAIRLQPASGRSANSTGFDWGFIVAAYMRAFAIIWLAKAIYEAARLIGLIGPPFQDLEPLAQASAGFSVIGDCIAGVGLWLTVSWGGAIWIAVILVEMAFSVATGAAPAVALVMLLPILVYLVLAILYARQDSQSL